MNVQKKIKKDSEKQYFGYSNQSNPFNDDQLTKPLQWGSSVQQKMNQDEVEREIEIVRKRRQEREKEKERLQEMRMKEFQNRDQDNYDDWLKKEQEFHEDQDKKRAILRIEQERYQPVDYMIQAIMVYKNELKQPNDIQYMKNPELIIKSLNNDELQICLKESEYQIQEEQIETYQQLWKYFIDIIKNKLESKLIIEDDQDIENLIKEKNVDQLNQMEEEINLTYNDQSFKMDVEYWEKILSKIRYQRAKQYLCQFYQDFDKLIDKKIIINKSDNKQNEQQQQISKNKHMPDYEQPLINHNYGDLSPLLLSVDSDLMELSITQQQCNENLNEQRNSYFMDQMNEIFEKIKIKLINEGKLQKDEYDKEQIDQEAYKYIDEYQNQYPLQDDEAQFDDVVDLSQQYSWIEKYKPRKPHYFNRVKLGFEWNKYNQTHYDLDNPPPKVIQGYKFNIFYPDLVDKNSTPSYSLHECDNENFCIVKFTAGPPYEDIAFKVLKQEWEFNDRHGFKCIFQKGILHLYVNFKKYRYKR